MVASSKSYSDSPIVTIVIMAVAIILGKVTV